MDTHVIVGLMGTGLYLLSYLLLQLRLLAGEGAAYVLMNLGGATLVAYSLLFDWNLAGMVLQIAWILISGIGLVRIARAQQKEGAPPTEGRRVRFRT